MELEGRVALVTGAGQRLGRAIAASLAGRGMTLAVHHHASGAGAEALREEIHAAGGRAECFAADLTDAAAARALPDRVAEAFGRLDVLVNSAAIMLRLGVADTSVAEWDRILDLNLRAPFFCAQGAAPHLRRARGSVVNIADLAGLEPWPGFAAHSVSKAGVVMLTRVLARALAPEVTVNAIAPGAVLVPESTTSAERERLARDTPLGRLGAPLDVTDTVLFLLEHGGFITGEVITVDGGRLLR